MVHRDSIHSIVALRTSAGKTVLAVVGFTVLAAAAAVAIIAATKESCPFLYSYDGTRYVFDGEPYGGATMRALERTDWSEMEHLVPVGGSYRVLVTNEVDETQHTNQLSLLAVDHAPGSSVILDAEGRPRAFRRLIPPVSARDEAGTDLLPWVRERDQVVWYPDLRAFSDRDPLEDTRNHIVLEFPYPAGAQRAYLVANIATGPWGSHMLRSMLGLRGRAVAEFYEAVNSNPSVRKQLHEWNLREELYVLFPEIETARGWERQGFIPGGGPLISESRAIPLDLSGVSGPTVRVRIHPPIGFWTLNSFHLAWEEDPVRTHELRPVQARRPSGRDVLGAIRDEDGRYLDFPDRGDRAEVWFEAPPLAPESRRTLFARTRGWYEIHLHDLKDPDRDAIARLTAEPGYAVRLAVSEFEEYRRTGVLLGTR